jgi:glutamate formiminotransferase / formiminotetrahydrofolate cyclodeaminase
VNNETIFYFSLLIIDCISFLIVHFSFLISHCMLECVPNFSEGRDLVKINAIAAEIKKIKDVKLLHIDTSYDANRTVMTFAGSPEAVVEAAFQAVKKAAELIDMRNHRGVHPRFGATDVLPLVPVSGITMEETVVYARKLGERIGNELGIHVYCYEYAAFIEKRRNLANCRVGEYENLPRKLADPEWKPDFGPVEFNAKSGAVAVGARNFLIAYNVNLATDDVNIAKAIAADIRESGKWIEVRPLAETGEEPSIPKKIHVPGTFKGLKAIGWYLPEIGRVQVSTNITDMHQAPVHLVFEAIRQKALQYGTWVTGSEIIGLVPLQVFLEAGKYFFPEKNAAILAKDKILQKLVNNLGLSELSEFNYPKRILEFCFK